MLYQPASRPIIDHRNYNFLQPFNYLMLQSPIIFSLISLIKHALTSGTFSTGAKPFVFKINFSWNALLQIENL